MLACDQQHKIKYGFGQDVGVTGNAAVVNCQDTVMTRLGSNTVEGSESAAEATDDQLPIMTSFNVVIEPARVYTKFWIGVCTAPGTGYGYKLIKASDTKDDIVNV